MLNHEAMRQLAKDRCADYEQQAKRERVSRVETMAVHQEPRERFRIRDLRWVLFRPHSA